TLRVDEDAPEPEMDSPEEREQAGRSAPASAPAPAPKSRAVTSDGAEGSGYSFGGDDLAMEEMAEYAPTPQDPSRLARVELQTGSTRYEVPHRVTIPDQSATMVLFVSKKVPGEAVFLYSPDGGVPDSYRHPFRVARFKNLSGGMLERGPIAVFEEGAFLGQGVVDALPADAQA